MTEQEAMTKRVTARVRARMQAIDRDIRRRAFDRDLATFSTGMADYRRLEERGTLACRLSQWATERSKARREGRGVSLDAMRERQRYVVETQGIVLAGHEATIARYRAHVASLERAHGITVRATAAYTQGYAWPRSKTIETAEIFTAESYSVRLHEIGHVVCPCPSTHQRVPMERPIFEGTTVCVACELVAWRWAITHALEWTEKMHAEMGHALPTYRRYATPAEQAEIDRLVSAIEFRAIQLRRATR